MKIAILTIAVAFAAALVGTAGALLVTTTAATTASAATPREVCCQQLGGRWVEGMSRAKAGQMVCAGVNSDAYYKCVAARTG